MDDVKQVLESYKYDYQYLLEKTKDNEKLKTEIEKCCSRLTVLRQKEKQDSVLTEQIEAVLEKQAKEENALLQIIARKQALENNINNLRQPYRTVLYLKYIRLLTFDEIASKMNYSTKRIYQLHKAALGEYEKLANSLTPAKGN